MYNALLQRMVGYMSQNTLLSYHNMRLPRPAKCQCFESRDETSGGFYGHFFKNTKYYEL
jgi:hypothetical protein